MRNSEVTSVEEVILHILDPHGPRGLRKSTFPLPQPVPSGPQLFAYFQQHIQKALRSRAAKAACFTSDAPGASLLWGLAGGSIDLVVGSGQLADQLFAIMKQNSRITEAALAVCLYHAKERLGDQPPTFGEERRYLAILKLDPPVAFRLREEAQPHGQLLITMEPEPDLIPTAGEKLQKCAFVPAPDARPRDHDLLLLDRQQQGQPGTGVAHFFSHSFLNARPLWTQEEETERLANRLHEIEQDLAAELDAPQQATLRMAIVTSLARPSLDLEEWPASLKLPDVVQRKIARKLSPRFLPNRQVKIDATTVQRLARRARVFLGDHGLRLEVPPNFDKRRLTARPGVTEAGVPVQVVQIETAVWKEVM